MALPLRHAVQHCRASPPPDWPREAYVFVGRHDIAARMAAAEEESRPEGGAGSSIVSTPLGRMAKAGSPSKRPPLRQPATPPGVLDRLHALWILCVDLPGGRPSTRLPLCIAAQQQQLGLDCHGLYWPCLAKGPDAEQGSLHSLQAPPTAPAPAVR